MQNESIIDTDIITTDKQLDLSNAVSVYVSNVGSTNCVFDGQSIGSSKNYPMDLGGTKLKENTKVKVSFTTGSGKLFCRIIRLLPCKCKPK